MPKVILTILDGFGLTRDPEVSAIAKAKTPFIDSLFDQYPHSRLSASGEDVGLPDGQFGNSEVGHLNIGAGRIVWQELSRINKAIEDGSFFENTVLLDAIKQAQKNGRLHITGLFSDGGVHSHNNHLFALLKFCKMHDIENVYVHALTDGRDTSPHGAQNYIKEFEEQARNIGIGKIASIIGRYYAMDRDNRWDRTQKAYEMFVKGKGTRYENPLQAVKKSYDNEITDEFIEPIIIGREDDSRIREEDVLIFYNIRGDRARQITRAFTEREFDKFPVDKLDLKYYTFTSYDSEFKNINVAFPPQEIKNTIGEVISRKGLKQLRIAETEKYPHVTYFFNGGVETPFESEERILVPSPQVATYDLQPEMSAEKVTDKLVKALNTNRFDFVVLNFANPDMVGHTGVMEAAIKAVETVDSVLEKVITTAIENDYKGIVIADHGNADILIQEDGSAHTAHTTALVPFIVVNEPDATDVRNGRLADVAPSLLKLLEIDQPEEMTGQPLFSL